MGVKWLNMPLMPHIISGSLLAGDFLDFRWGWSPPKKKIWFQRGYEAWSLPILLNNTIKSIIK
jgi:hypothetical protein